jgi:hypothetical protein
MAQVLTPEITFEIDFGWTIRQLGWIRCSNSRLMSSYKEPSAKAPRFFSEPCSRTMLGPIALRFVKVGFTDRCNVPSGRVRTGEAIQDCRSGPTYVYCLITRARRRAPRQKMPAVFLSCSGIEMGSAQNCLGPPV